MGMKHILVVSVLFIFSGCSSMNYSKTVKEVDIPKYMGTWYVWAGRTTFMEKGAYNAIERYSWNEEKKRVDIDFTFRQSAFDGELKKIPQKAWIDNSTDWAGSGAKWSVSPFWPLKFDYLIIALDPAYQWVAIGVPSGSYLWIMGREQVAPQSKINEIVEQLKVLGYPTQDIEIVPQKPEEKKISGS